MANQKNYTSGYKKRQARILSGNPGPRQMYVPFGSPEAARRVSPEELEAYRKELAAQEAAEAYDE